MKMSKNRILSTKVLCACCSAGSTITSLGCMAIMTTTITATSAVAIGSMGAMAISSNLSLTLLNSIGLEFLTKINLRTLEIFLVILLLIGIASMYLSYVYHKKPFPLILFVISSILIYVGIFVVMSNLVYYLSLVGLIAATVINFKVKTNGNRK